MVSVDEQVRVIASGVVDLISEADLRRKLERGGPLRVKLGIDPTASDIHLGFAVVLRKLRQFQDLGHTAVLIIGDFTAQVGDPSGRSATRPPLSKAEVDAHAATYLEQVRRILETRRAALEAVTRRLIECEVIDGTELRDIVEASTDSPQLVPGTDTDRRPPRPAAEAAEQPPHVADAE